MQKTQYQEPSSTTTTKRRRDTFASLPPYLVLSFWHGMAWHASWWFATKIDQSKQTRQTTRRSSTRQALEDNHVCAILARASWGSLRYFFLCQENDGSNIYGIHNRQKATLSLSTSWPFQERSRWVSPKDPQSFFPISMVGGLSLWLGWLLFECFGAPSSLNTRRQLSSLQVILICFAVHLGCRTRHATCRKATTITGTEWSMRKKRSRVVGMSAIPPYLEFVLLS